VEILKVQSDTFYISLKNQWPKRRKIKGKDIILKVYKKYLNYVHEKIKELQT